ncbi:MAG: porin [Gammaproteobacteria bacterium]|nr:porin [Gammaproteobacteria bacterium]MBU1980159.1 porin [Gammaproteobacteria bacterium]
MNKKLIALAVAAAIAPAAAMADSGNVTIYGQAHVSLDNNSYGTSTAGVNSEKNTRLSSNTSLIGFKGTEDLGNGLSAIWQMEADISMDSRSDAAAATSGGFASRNTYLGLSSKTMGTALFGKHDSPYKMATGSLDNMADTVGDYNGIVGQVNGVNYFDSRLGNVSAYISPNFSGFSFAGAIVAANETSSTTQPDGKAYSLMGKYENGPFFASLAREKASNTQTAVSTQTALPMVGANNDAAATKIGLGYKIDAFKLGLVWEKISASNATLGATVERKGWSLPVSYTMGANAINFTYGKAGSTTNTTDNGAKMYALGLNHSLSKRTSAYVVYAKMDNDTNGAYALGLAGTGHGQTVTPVGTGADVSSLSVGMKHTF